ncbi:MAG TPA: alpha/beta hydrolase-fold protein [Candidatus Angelobacter sp.]
MTKYPSRSLRRLLVLAVLLAISVPAQLVAQSLRFHIKVAPELGNTPVSGRMIVFLSSEKEPKKELSQGFADTTNQVWITAQEVHDVKPGETVDVDPDRLAFPKPLSQAPAGDYQAMALLDVNHNYAYRGDRPGDLRSVVVALKSLNPASSQPVDLVLTERIPEKEIKLPPPSEMLDFVSPSLSAFWGRPIHMRGIVLLPPKYEQDTQKYPVVYWTHGFGAILNDLAQYVVPQYAGLMAQGKIPPMIYVFLDESCPGGTHEFADSVNNGPWGKALTTELIPYLEGKYRMDGKPSGRLLTGHSSGGWAVLWLQVTYPTVFGGSWPTSPDPSDFHNFTGPDLRANPPQNFYRKPDGSPWMLVRMGGRDVIALENYARQETVLGEYGGQISSFDWVFSPRGQDGRPQQLFEHATGVIDPEVAKAWEKYDIAEVLRRNVERLRPLLQDKIHLTVGTEDTFHLDGPAHLLDATMKDLGIRATFTYLEGRTHFDLYRGGLTEKIANEMEKIARPNQAEMQPPPRSTTESHGESK